MINESIFRAYDIRGECNKDINKNIAYYIGMAFVEFNLEESADKNIFIAYDGRLSSLELLQGLVNGIYAAGGTVTILGLLATPMLYFADKFYKPAASIMITGSHNPKNDNGFKMLCKGQPFYGEQIQQLKQLVKTLMVTAEANNNQPLDIILSTLPTIDCCFEYIERILQDIKISADLKIIWDNFNGAAGQVLEKLIEQLPNQNIVINSQIDGSFPKHQPDPTVKANLAELIDQVIINKYDIGIAFDGDGDRISVIDSLGNFITGDQLTAIFAIDMARQSKYKNENLQVVFDIKASNILLNFLSNLNISPIISPAGHTSIKRIMKENNVLLGGEMSGHMFFYDKYYGYDDAPYAALRLIDLLTRSEESLYEHYKKLPQSFITPEIRLFAGDDAKFVIVEHIKDKLQTLEDCHVDYIDGIKVENANGWWLLRASNTEPVLVLRYEAVDVVRLNILKAELNDYLKPFNLMI